jgi:hypothetical protein
LKINDQDQQIASLKEYIKNKAERGTGEAKIRQLEEEFAKLRAESSDKVKELQDRIVKLQQ